MGNPLACEPIVSLQRLGAADPLSGHISWGALVAPALVVVPGPIDAVLAHGPFDVLLASASPLGTAAPGTVERIRPSSAEVVGKQSRPDGAILALHLDHASRHAAGGAAVSALDLAARIDQEDDLWVALEAVGAVTPGIQFRPPDQVLEPVGAWERLAWQEISTVTPLLLGTGGEISIKWCGWRPCDCPGPWWGP